MVAATETKLVTTAMTVATEVDTTVATEQDCGHGCHGRDSIDLVWGCNYCCHG